MVMHGTDQSTISELAKMTAASQAERIVLVRDLFLLHEPDVRQTNARSLPARLQMHCKYNRLYTVLL